MHCQGGENTKSHDGSYLSKRTRPTARDIPSHSALMSRHPVSLHLPSFNLRTSPKVRKSNVGFAFVGFALCANTVDDIFLHPSNRGEFAADAFEIRPLKMLKHTVSKGSGAKRSPLTEFWSSRFVLESHETALLST